METTLRKLKQCLRYLFKMYYQTNVTICSNIRVKNYTLKIHSVHGDIPALAPTILPGGLFWPSEKTKEKRKTIQILS